MKFQSLLYHVIPLDTPRKDPSPHRRYLKTAGNMSVAM